ncbi:uncharacterized protein LOC135925132 isoform X2 [Gordionus sp. m RMFG-2023]|uniref:uncharacterized protein LOC135925132 isoform X2 n=1 Tax=Gordionus sp. m RMFG-2023 TaxID=3053472 RepID=UPI0031FC7D32
MAIMKSCCFCFSPRTGSVLCAIISLIIFLIEAGFTINKLADRQSGRQGNDNKDVLIALWGLELFFVVLLVISTILLILGIRQNTRKLFWPWMVSTSIIIMIVLMTILIAERLSALAPGNGVLFFVIYCAISISIALFLKKEILWLQICVVVYGPRIEMLETKCLLE